MASSTISSTPRPPRLPPGRMPFSLSWLRRRSSSRSGGVGPDDCGPEPHGPLEPPEPHGPPPWLLHGIEISPARPIGSGPVWPPYMGRLYGFQRKRALRPAVAELALTLRRGVSFDVAHEIEGRITALPGRMRLTRCLAPDRRIDGREDRIALRLHVDAGDLQPVGAGHRLRVKLRAPDHHDVGAAA